MSRRDSWSLMIVMGVIGVALLLSVFIYVVQSLNSG